MARFWLYSGRAWLALLLPILLLCAGLSVVSASPASAMENGQPITSAPPWAAYVTTVGGFKPIQWGETSCTGTIIANDWVLTAAHCVVADDKNGKPTSRPLALSKFEVVLGRSDLTKTRSQGAQWTVDKLVIYPNYPAAGASDVALMHLHGALPAKALPLPLAPASYSLSDGQAMSAYGYGNVSETYPPQAITKQEYDKYVGTATHVFRLTQPGSYVEQTSCNLTTDWCLHRVGQSEILHGDSGGPWVTDPANPFVVGVTSVIASPQKASSTTVVWQYVGATRLTNGAAHDWVARTAGLIRPQANTIYRDPSTGASWLSESDGFDHPIPTGDTYLCLTGKGDSVVNLPTFTLNEIPRSTASATCEAVGPKKSILLYGDNDPSDNDPSGMSNLASVLTAAGYKVTSMPGVTSLPSDISGYGQIWHYGVEDSPSTADQQTFESFVKAGGSVFLTGDWGNTSNWDNLADEDIINALVPTGPVSIPGESDLGSHLAVNSAVIDKAAETPNALTTFTGRVVGGITGVPSANVFVSDSDGQAAGALWDNLGSGHGRLAVIMDINWPQTSFKDATTMPGITQNLAYFLSQN